MVLSIIKKKFFLWKFMPSLFKSDFRYLLWFSSYRGYTPTYLPFYFWSHFKFLLFESSWKSLPGIINQNYCFWVIRGQRTVGFIFGLMSPCLSVSKTNIVTTLVPTFQGSTTAVISCCTSWRFLLPYTREVYFLKTN